MKINSQKLYRETARHIPEWPVAPDRVYKSWHSYGDFLGTGRIADQHKKYRTFREARKFARSLNLKSREQWKTYCTSGSKPADIPTVASHTYRKQWEGWGNFLGTWNRFSRSRASRNRKSKEGHLETVQQLLRQHGGTLPNIKWLRTNGHVDLASSIREHPEWYSSVPIRKMVNKETCLNTLQSDLSKQWHHTKNGKLTPNDVTPGSGKKVWWQCKKGHEWKAIVSSRTKGSGCPYCAGLRATQDTCLATVNPQLANEWHPAKNGKLTPNDVTSGSNKKVCWKCKKGHEWIAQVSSRNRTLGGCGCPYCGGKKVNDNNCLSTVSPSLAKEWHPIKNELTPNDVTSGSNKKVWWKCEKGHEWQAVINSRSMGNGCPFCSGRFADYRNCLACRNPNIAKEWHPTNNGNLTPRNVTKRSGKKVWWKCKKGHEWIARIADRTDEKRSTRCPHCRVEA